MSILTGTKILKEIEHGNIVIDPFNPKCVNPNSVNLTLSPNMYVAKSNYLSVATGASSEYEKICIPEHGAFLEPNELYIAATNERTWTDKYVPQLDGRSSIARLGIFVHTTAGFGDIGFDGVWTLEISVIKPVFILPNIEICQIYFNTVKGSNEIKYKGKYQGARSAKISKMHEEFREMPI